MRAFHSWNNALCTTQKLESIQGFLVINTYVFHHALFMEHGMFWAYTGIIQTGRNGINLYNLSIFILSQIAIGAMQYTGTTVRAGQGLRIVTHSRATASSLYPEFFYLGIILKLVESANGIGAATYTCLLYTSDAADE